MKKCFLMFVMVVLTCNSAFAAVMWWVGEGGTTDWHTAANWTKTVAPYTYAVPYQSYNIRIGIYANGAEYVVDVNSKQALTGGLQIGWDSWGPVATLNLNGTADLWCKDAGSIFQGQSYGVVNVNDSSYGRAAVVWLDGMQLNLNGSNCWFQFATNDWQILGDSYVSVNAGTLIFTNGSTFSAYDGSLGYNPNFTGTIDVAGGKLKLDGDDRDAVNWHINNGNIIAYGGGSGSGLDVTYDGTYTWVEAVFDGVYSASPSNEAVDVLLDSSLSWMVSPNVLSSTLYLGQRPQADLSGDDTVNIEDLSMLVANYLDLSITALDEADITHDLSIDLDDFAKMAQQWQTQTVLTPVQTVTNDGSNGPFVYTPPTPLDSDTEYFWRVDATTASETITGVLWQFETPSSDPIVYWTFDDKYVSNWVAAIPIFDQYDAKATFCVAFFDELNSSEIAGLHTLETAGHAIACHSLNHLKAVDYVNTYSLEQYWLDDVKPALDLMLANGFNPRCFAYPNSQNNEQTDQMLLQHFKYLRTGVPYSEASLIFNDPVDVRSGGCFYSTSVDSDGTAITVEDLYALLDQAKTQKKSIVLYSHDIAESSDNQYHHYTNEQRLHDILSYGTSIGLRFKGLD